jgi:hypothetical protein
MGRILAAAMRTSTISDEDLQAVGVGRCFLFDTLDDATADGRNFGEEIRAHWIPTSEHGTLDVTVVGGTWPLSISWRGYRNPTSRGPSKAHIGVFSMDGEPFRMTERCLQIGQHSTGGTVFVGEHTTSDGVCCDELIRAAGESVVQLSETHGALRMACSWADDIIEHHGCWIRQAVRLALNPHDHSGVLVRIDFCDSSQ